MAADIEAWPRLPDVGHDASGMKALPSLRCAMPDIWQPRPIRHLRGWKQDDEKKKKKTPPRIKLIETSAHWFRVDSYVSA